MKFMPDKLRLRRLISQTSNKTFKINGYYFKSFYENPTLLDEMVEDSYFQIPEYPQDWWMSLSSSHFHSIISLDFWFTCFYIEDNVWFKCGGGESYLLSFVFTFFICLSFHLIKLK